MQARIRTAVAALFMAFITIAVRADQYGDFTYESDGSSVTITGYIGAGGHVVVPELIEGLPVVAIGDFAMGWNADITAVTILDTVVSIGYGAFYGCGSLASVAIGSFVTEIGAFAFNECTSLAAVALPDSVASVGEQAFNGCTSLTGAYFKGDAPVPGWDVFNNANLATVYYLAGASGWGETYEGRPTALWELPGAVAAVNVGFKNGVFGFDLTGADGQTVVVEACADLKLQNWVPVSTNTLTGGTSSFTDPDWGGYPARFYRTVTPEH